MKNQHSALFVLVAVFAFTTILSPATYAQPVINEVMSSNSSVILDEDGASADWIELYNQSDMPLNISGYGLTDNPSNPFKWTFPAYTMESGEYLLVYASGKDRKNPEQFHTNFKISQSGETVMLTKPAGTVADSVYTGYIPTNKSLGRIPDGGPDLLLFTTITPGAANELIGYDGFADSVAFSSPGKFYDSAVTIELTTPSPDAAIYFTLDSSEPTQSSYRYTSPLSIPSTKVLRARAYETGKLPGNIITETYIIGYNRPETEVAEYFISCKQSDFDYIYAHYEDDIYVPVTIKYNGRTWSDVKMRIRGDDTRSFRKKSLKLNFFEELFENNVDKINFNAEYYDKSYISQYVSSRLMGETGQPTYESEHARLYLNGQYLGLYLRIENVDEYFLEANGLDPNGNLYKATFDGACLSVYDDVDSLWEKKTNTDTGMDDLIELIDKLNSVPDKDYYSFANEYLDYDKMINIIALNILLAHGSTYYHNYYMYHDIHGTNKWTMLPWDMDKSLGYHYTVDYPYERSSPATRSDNPFHERAIINETILNDIRTWINDFSGTIFQPDYVVGIIDSLQNALETSIIEDSAFDAYKDNVDLAKWYGFISDSRNYAENRIANLNYQFDNYPRSFKVEPTPERVYETPTFVWHPSTDPNGDPLTYTFVYGTSEIYWNATEITGIIDTTYTLPFELSPGTYYWKVRASDGSKMVTWHDNSYLCEGFNTRNVFTILENSSVPGTITSDIVLTESKSPYYVTGDITVNQEGLLTIEPGVELIISEDAHIFVRGSLTAEGTEEKPIVIRPPTEAVRWGAICFDNAAGSSIIHAVISGASQGEDTVLYRSAISSRSTNLLLEHVRFTGNLESVYTTDCDLTIRYCIFEDNNSGQHVDATGGTATVEYSELHKSGAGDAIDYNTVLGGSVSHNVIYGSPDDGIDIGSGSLNIEIAGNKIYQCVDKGISIGEKSLDIDITGNIITHSAIGIAVKDSSTAIIDHNTLYGNDTSISAYNSVQSIPYGGFASVTNSILSLSGSASISTDDISSIVVSYSLSDKELITGNNNVFDEPLFNSPVDNDFGLREGSAAIGKGFPNGEGIASDIGAVPYSSASSVDEIVSDTIPTAFSLCQNYPNPFNPITTISYQLPKPAEVTITIYTSLGQRVREYPVGRMEPGIYEMVFDATDLTSGLYFYRVEAGRESLTGKMLYMK